MEIIGAEPGPGGPRSVAAERGLGWLTDAWPLFRTQAGLWVLLTVIGMGLVLVCSVVPLLGSLAMPFVSTLVAAGLMLVARKQRGGGVPEVSDLFAILSHPALTRLLILTLIYVALSFGAALLVMLVFGMGGGAVALTGLLAGDESAGMAAFGGSLMLGILVYMAIIVPILAMYWFAVPLVLFCESEPWPAMTASLRATLANVVPMLVYGVVGLVMVVLAAIPLMLGFLVAAPLLMISWLISFDEIFA
jgi:uncharacterized membrane protein